MTGISLTVARAILNDLAQTGATRFALDVPKEDTNEEVRP